MPTAAADRPHRLTADEADRCHAPCWDDAEIAAFLARVERFTLLGRADADALAERLTLRDRDGDDRRLCVECHRLGGRPGAWRCGSRRAAGVARDLPGELVTQLQRCPGFKESTT